MPPKPTPYREVRRKLLAAGFHEASQKGSHVKFIKITLEYIRTATVPKHREVAMGTLKSILRQAGIEQDVFDDL
ncbi:MAG: type II toxin-antitoxin system HicA family toxin [Candidatus Sumerlaeota bacterium]|nr:type II toxin-antitoxin system HicA family toxin [Candidatus Sumerlaeota bacterium]